MSKLNGRSHTNAYEVYRNIFYDADGIILTPELNITPRKQP